MSMTSHCPPLKPLRWFLPIPLMVWSKVSASIYASPSLIFSLPTFPHVPQLLSLRSLDFPQTCQANISVAFGALWPLCLEESSPDSHLAGCLSHQPGIYSAVTSSEKSSLAILILPKIVALTLETFPWLILFYNTYN